MIQSKHNAFGFWLCMGTIALFIFFTICCITKYYFEFTIIKVQIPNQRSFNVWMVFNSITCSIFGLILVYRASLITIDFDDKFSKSISFKNFFTRQIKTYTFDEFDGYITTKLWHKQLNENKTLCLIKEGRIVKKIDNFFYSNVDELQMGLTDMKYLGRIKMGFINSWKDFFNRPIIKS